MTLLWVLVNSVDLLGAVISAFLSGSQLIDIKVVTVVQGTQWPPRLDSGNTVLNRIDKGSLCVSQVASHSLFTVKLPLKRAWLPEALKGSFLLLLERLPTCPLGGHCWARWWWAAQVWCSSHRLQQNKQWWYPESQAASPVVVDREGPRGTEDNREEVSGWAQGGAAESASCCARVDQGLKETRPPPGPAQLPICSGRKRTRNRGRKSGN